MSSKFYEILAYVVALVILLGVFFAWGFSHGDKYIQGRWDVDKAAQAQALAKAEANTILWQANYNALLSKAEADHAQMAQANAALAGQFTDGLRHFEATVRRFTLPGAVAHPPGPESGSAGAAKNPGLDELAQRAVSACLESYAQWKAITELEPK